MVTMLKGNTSLLQKKQKTKNPQDELTVLEPVSSSTPVKKKTRGILYWSLCGRSFHFP